MSKKKIQLEDLKEKDFEVARQIIHEVVSWQAKPVNVTAGSSWQIGKAKEFDHIEQGRRTVLD